MLYLPRVFVPAAVVACATSALFAQTAQQTVLAVTAVANASPPSLTFSWPADATATSFVVLRRMAGALSWGVSTPIPGGGTATGWTDTNVVPGQRYEYWFAKNGGVAARTFVTAGVEATALENRGKLVLLVDSTKVTALGARLDRLIQDLVGDGWGVLRHDVSPTDSVQSVKNLILADAGANPTTLKAVFLLGRIPVPYSGLIAPDGHPDHSGAWASDVYYGELTGGWTDSTANTTSASRLENRNVPGDGKFDQSSIPSDIELGVGRVDFANMPAFALSETALLQQYLDKDHDYRHKVFAVDQRAVIDDNFGYFSGEAFAASGWRNFNALVGPGNIVAADYFTTLNVASGGGHVWSYGCGGGSYQSAGGIGTTNDFALSQNRSVFTMLFGSYFGDWDSTNNFLRAPLCQGWTLANAWAGRPHWSFHSMALGETLGYCTRYSQNDTSAGGYGTRWVHLALMGDPTLRQHVIAPPSGVAIADQWPAAGISWTPSADAVAGYHVYRAADPLGPFTRITTTPVVATSFVDPAAPVGAVTYMVRALRLETTPVGSYWNLSQGAFAQADLPTALAGHSSYGAGCYTLSDSLHATFATPAVAAAGLGGTSYTFTPNAGGYSLVAGGGNWMVPGGAALALALGDDDQVAVPLATPFAHPAGAVSTLHVHGNGIVALAPLAMAAGASAEPSAAGLLGEAATAFYAWHDFAPHEAGSGLVQVEEVGGVLYVTWNGVESHPVTVANPGWQQFQFELATGVVRLVFGALPTLGTGQQVQPSEQWVVGYSPGGASVDGGALAWPGDLPATCGTVNLAAPRLSAGPAPVVTASTGVNVTFTLDQVPEYSPGSWLGLIGHGFAANVPGAPLDAFGLPGCAQHVGSFVVTTFVVGTSSALTAVLPLPAGFPRGLTVYSQGLALVPPGSLPNGQNAAGAVVSNGLASFVNDR